MQNRMGIERVAWLPAVDELSPTLSEDDKKLAVGAMEKAKSVLMTFLHYSVWGAHQAEARTYERLRRVAYWKGMTGDLHRFLRNCPICVRTKSHQTDVPLLQPARVYRPWGQVAVDFVGLLPPAHGRAGERLSWWRWTRSRGSCLCSCRCSRNVCSIG